MKRGRAGGQSGRRGGVRQKEGRGGGGGGGGVSGSGWGSGLSDEQNVVLGGCLGAIGGAERGGAQSDEMKGGEMKSLKRDEEDERAEHT